MEDMLTYNKMKDVYKKDSLPISCLDEFINNKTSTKAQFSSLRNNRRWNLARFSGYDTWTDDWDNEYSISEEYLPSQEQINIHIRKHNEADLNHAMPWPVYSNPRGFF